MSRNRNGEEIGLKEQIATRVTIGSLGQHHGIDSGKRVVVSLLKGDIIEFKPYLSRRPKQMSVFDLYDFVIRSESAAMAKIKRMEKKERHQARLARQRQERFEKRLFEKRLFNK